MDVAAQTNIVRLLEETVLPLGLAFPRLIVAFHVIPMLGASTVPMMVRTAVVMSLALFLHPLHAAAVPSEALSPLVWFAIVMKETAIGFFIGFVCSLFIWVLEAVGETLDTLVGNQMLSIFNPMLNQQTGPFAIMLSQFAVMYFIALGGFGILLNAFFSSFVVWPVMTFYPQWTETARHYLLDRSIDVLRFAFQLSAPLLVIFSLVDLSLGLVNRKAQEINAFMLSFPLKAVVAVTFLSMTLIFVTDPENPVRPLMQAVRSFIGINL